VVAADTTAGDDHRLSTKFKLSDRVFATTGRRALSDDGSSTSAPNPGHRRAAVDDQLVNLMPVGRTALSDARPAGAPKDLERSPARYPK